ncbi:MAG: hypothetical protein RLZZ618_3135 [Pseudomonadota bacterium]
MKPWDRMVCKFHAAMINSFIPSFPVLSPVRRSLRHAALMLALAAGLAGPAWAEKADRYKQMDIESDLPGKVDLKSRLVVFNGNVVITKGTMSIHANRIEVQEGSNGAQKAVAKGTAGSPARFRQKREGVNEFIEGEADQLDYDSGTDTLRFVNKASVRRLRGTDTADEVSGALIVYDAVAELITVSGGATAATPTNPTGRVKVTLIPAAAEPTATPAPASGAKR